MKLSKLKFFAYLLLLFHFELALGQSNSAIAKLQGSSKEEVYKLLGQPSRSSGVPSGGNSFSSETLYYGDSQITLINSRVSSIFDMGELQDILNKKPGKNSNDQTWVTWPNQWTSPKNLLDKNI